VSNTQDQFAEEIASDAHALVKERVLTPQALEFLKACLLARLNLVISGPSENGNTRLLQALASFLPEEDQKLAILGPDEAALTGKGITTLRANLSSDQDKGVITRGYLLTLVSKMHPQRVLLDKVQGPEALPLLKVLFAMDGVLFSVVADSPADAFVSLEEMALRAEAGLRADMTRRVLAGSLDLVIQSETVKDDATRVVSIVEVADVKDGVIELRDIFLLRQAGAEPAGVLCPTGVRPHFLGRMELLGISLPPAAFALPDNEKGRGTEPRHC